MTPLESESPQPIAPGLQVEQRTPPVRHLRPLLLVPLLVLVLGSATLLAWLPRSSPVLTLPPPSGAFQRSPSPSAQPTLTWSDDHVDVILSPGETASRSLTLTANRTVGGLRFCLSPALVPFLQVHALEKNADDEKDIDASEANDPRGNDCNKDHFQLKAGSSRPVELSFHIPTGTTLGTYEGTVEIHHGSQTLLQTIKAVLNIWSTFSSQAFKVSFKLPPAFSVESTADSIRLQNYTATSTETSEGLLPGQMFIEIYTIALPGNEDYVQRLSDAQPIFILGQSGVRGYRSTSDISPLPGYDMYVPSDAILYIFAGTYDGVSSSSIDTIKKIQESVQVND